MTKLATFLLLITVHVYGFSQESKLDSLLELSNTNEGRNSTIDQTSIFEAIFTESIATNKTGIRNQFFSKLYDLYYSQLDYFQLSNIVRKQLDCSKMDSSNNEIDIAKLEMKYGYFLNKTGDILNSIEHYNNAMIIGTYTDSSLIDYFYRYIAINQSVNYATIADYDKAIQLQSEALDYFMTRSLNETVKCHNNLGDYYTLSNDYNNAIKHYNISISLRDSTLQSHLVPTPYVGLSKIALNQHDPDRAISLLDEALAFINKSPPSYNTKEVLIELYLTKSLVYKQLNNTERSFLNATQSLEIATKYYNHNKHRRLGYIHNTLGLYQLDNKEFDDAENHFKKALDNLTQNTTDPQIMVAYNGMINCMYYNSKTKNTQVFRDKIIDLVNRANDVYYKLKQMYKNDPSKYFLAEFSDHFLSIGISVCFDSYTETKRKTYLNQGLLFSEYSKASALIDAITKHKTFDPIQEKHNIEINKLTTLKQEQTYLLSESTSSNDSVSTLSYKKNIRTINLQLDVLNKQTSYNVQPEITNIDFKDIQKYLKSNDISLIEYHCDEENLFVFSIRDSSVNCKRISLSNSLERELNNTLQSFTFENRHRYNHKSAKALFNILWPNEAIKHRVLIIPCNKLMNLPFEALTTNSNNYLIKTHSIQYSLSINSLITKGYYSHQNEFNNQALCISPNFKQSKNNHLKNSLTEIESIENVIESRLLLDDEASKTNYLSQSPNFSVIHITTHGEYNEKTETSYIQFSEKKLFASELYNMHLTNPLVVLSACETADGKNQSTEGLLSLSRAFTYAGIPSVISSQWAVEERSTALVFSHFYQGLSQNKSTASALSDAKLSYLNNPLISKEYKTPFYWAGFMHWGIDQSLSLNKKSFSFKTFLSRSPNSLILITLLLILLMLFRYFKR